MINILLATCTKLNFIKPLGTSYSGAYYECTNYCVDLISRIQYFFMDFREFLFSLITPVVVLEKGQIKWTKIGLLGETHTIINTAQKSLKKGVFSHFFYNIFEDLVFKIKKLYFTSSGKISQIHHFS